MRSNCALEINTKETCYDEKLHSSSSHMGKVWICTGKHCVLHCWVFFLKRGWSEAMDLYKEECYSFMMCYSTFLGVLLPFQRTFALPLHSNTAAAPCESIRFVSVSKLPDLRNVFLSTYTLVEYTQDLQFWSSVFQGTFGAQNKTDCSERSILCFIKKFPREI